MGRAKKGVQFTLKEQHAVPTFNGEMWCGRLKVATKLDAVA